MAENTVHNAVKLVGEGFVLPGTSLLLDGDIKAGAGHAIVGVLARSLFGPIGWFAAAANSFSESTSGKSLVEHLKSARPAKAATKP
jgi:hypothetical protein